MAAAVVVAAVEVSLCGSNKHFWDKKRVKLGDGLDCFGGTPTIAFAR